MKEKDKISIRDIHQTHWKCRDFELTNLWQRSIFLTAFLVLFFTAYGGVMSKAFDNSSNTKAVLILTVVGYLISLVGISLSVLWIKMGKGSKAWYEIYESVISRIEGDKKYATEEARETGAFQYHKLPEYKVHGQIDTDILSGNAGPFSVSKINIGLGRIFLSIWIVIGITHSAVGALFVSMLTNQASVTILFVTVSLIVIGAIIWKMSKASSYSSSSIGDFYKK